MDIETKSSKEPMALIVIGMAGSGKTTFMQKFYHETTQSNQSQEPPFVINLDPAVQFLPYLAHIDIRKQIDYKKVMKDHQLGPNGAIMTCLNLFCAQFDNVLAEIDKEKSRNDLFIVDTPGQIEVFTWSASGQIIAQSIGSTLPTALVYIIDAAKCQNPNSFMSNMMFCCSIFYKMKLPIIVVINKADCADADKLIQWMQDYEKFEESLEKEKCYSNTLSRSMCLSLDEFYKDLNVVAVSSISGYGFDKLDLAIQKAKKEYDEVFLPEIVKNKIQNEDHMINQKKVQDELKKYEKDLKNLDINKLDNQTINQVIDTQKAQKVTFNLGD